MPFNSFGYFIFLLLVVTFSWIVKSNFKTYFLLFASCFFIGYYQIESLFFLFLSVIATYLSAKKIDTCKKEFNRKLLYRSGVVFNILLLLSLKLLEEKSFKTFRTDSLLIFIGISYYSLQNIAFLTDTYFKRLKFKTTFWEFSLFTAFFPKIIAGPIEFPNGFIPEIQKINERKQLFFEGLQRVILGLLKKTVIADRLAEIVQFNFDNDTSIFGITNLFVSYIFTFQLYFDFSGYSDIAIGSSKMLGINLKENFQFPLASKSITEFWRKWHISLSTWLTNYIFYPMSFRIRKLKKMGVIISIFITFLISGIWHGFAITFIIYALLHSFYLIIEFITQNQREVLKKRIPNSIHLIISTFITFNLISISLIYFRSHSIQKANSILMSIFNFNHFQPKNWLKDFFAKLATNGELDAFFNFMVTIILLFFLYIYESKIRHRIEKNKVNLIFIVCSVLIIFMFGVFKSRDQFIYSQF